MTNLCKAKHLVVCLILVSLLLSMIIEVNGSENKTEDAVKGSTGSLGKGTTGGGSSKRKRSPESKVGSTGGGKSHLDKRSTEGGRSKRAAMGRARVIRRAKVESDNVLKKE
jgi:hypothetical protein